ncbi:apolipoprotein A-IV-like [Myxocyprinus asiaticus]|uniref:apolipoprotein A-IV-like n=1 Tax=Myxocyprinus asiaticus TaxID=70543 RepID=UPI002221BEDC|nr:apolipoprotein A-IV-like [Myxocyprinus asiaticus]
MKVHLVLALVVFTGCQANLLYADEPKPQVEQLTDAFRSYFTQATRSAEETIQMIRTSQLGQEVNQLAITLKSQMDPLAEDLKTKITKGAEMLRERVGVELYTVRCALKPYFEYVITDPIKKGVDYLRSLDSETLKDTLLHSSEELRGNLEQSVKELQAQLEPYSEGLREKLDPYTQNLKAQLTSLYESLTKNN